MTNITKALIGKIALMEDVNQQAEYLALLDPFFYEEKEFIEAILEKAKNKILINQYVLEQLGLSQDLYITCVAQSSSIGGLDAFRHAFIEFYSHRSTEIIKSLKNIKEIASTLKQIEEKINSLSGQDISTLDDIYAKSVEEQIKNPRDLSSLPKTGFQEMDQVFKGFIPGQLITIGGYSGVGKSTFIFSLIRNLAHKHKILMVSLEMDNQIVYYRLLSGMSGVPFDYLLGMNNPKQVEWLASKAYLTSITEAQNKLHSMNLKMTDNRYSLVDIVATIRKEAKEGGLDFVFIDYLQLIKATDTRQPMRLQIGEITRELKLLAQELGITIICLAQLSRMSQDREVPMVRDLKESGNIESDSDAIFLLYRRKDITHLKLAKDRMFGMSGIAELKYVFETQTYK